VHVYASLNSDPKYLHIFQAFNVVFQKAIDRAEPAEEVKLRVNNLIDCITFSVFIYTTRGLFEKDKLIFTAQVAFQVRNARVNSWFPSHLSKEKHLKQIKNEG